jgi:hypothetical protein
LTSWIQPGPDGGRSADESGHVGHVEKDGSMSRGSGRQLSHSMYHLKVGISAGNGGLLATPWRPALPVEKGAGVSEETPHPSSVRGFFFSGRRNRFAAIRIALARKDFLLNCPSHPSPWNVSDLFSPASKAGLFLRSSCFRMPGAPAARASGLVRGVRRERPINESGIEQTVVAFDVMLKCLS